MDISKLREDLYLDDPSRIMELSEANVVEEMLRQASLYAFYSRLLVDIKKKRLKTEFNLKVLEAELDLEIRKNNVGSKTTETMIRSLILTNQRYIDMYNTLIDLIEQEELVKVIVRSLEQRKDMIMSYLSLVRSEAGQLMGMTIRKEQR